MGRTRKSTKAGVKEPVSSEIDQESGAETPIEDLNEPNDNENQSEISENGASEGQGTEEMEEKADEKIDDLRLPDKSLFRIDEVASYFDVSERTIRLWIEHGHLQKEKIVGTIRVSRRSILRCRFKKLALGPEL